MSIIDSLKWRYATKRMNGQKVEQAKLDYILDAIQLSASAFGLQPYSIMVVEDEALRAKLHAAGYGQPQIIESSHLLVFSAWTTVTEERISAFIEDVARKRNIPLATLDGYKNALLQHAASLSTPEAQRNWAARQAYIALGTGIAAAAELKVDASPMEGCAPEQFNEILGLNEKGLHAVALMAIGYRSEEDSTASFAKVRRDKSLLFEHF